MSYGDIGRKADLVDRSSSPIGIVALSPHSDAVYKKPDIAKKLGNTPIGSPLANSMANFGALGLDSNSSLYQPPAHGFGGVASSSAAIGSGSGSNTVAPFPMQMQGGPAPHNPPVHHPHLQGPHSYSSSSHSHPHQNTRPVILPQSDSFDPLLALHDGAPAPNYSISTLNSPRLEGRPSNTFGSSNTMMPIGGIVSSNANGSVTSSPRSHRRSPSGGNVGSGRIGGAAMSPRSMPNAIDPAVVVPEIQSFGESMYPSALSPRQQQQLLLMQQQHMSGHIQYPQSPVGSHQYHHPVYGGQVSGFSTSGHNGSGSSSSIGGSGSTASFSRDHQPNNHHPYQLHHHPQPQPQPPQHQIGQPQPQYRSPHYSTSAPESRGYLQYNMPPSPLSSPRIQPVGSMHGGYGHGHGHGNNNNTPVSLPPPSSVSPQPVPSSVGASPRQHRRTPSWTGSTTHSSNFGPSGSGGSGNGINGLADFEAAEEWLSAMGGLELAPGGSNSAPSSSRTPRSSLMASPRVFELADVPEEDDESLFSFSNSLDSPRTFNTMNGSNTGTGTSMSVGGQRLPQLPLSSAPSSGTVGRRRASSPGTFNSSSNSSSSTLSSSFGTSPGGGLPTFGGSASSLLGIGGAVLAKHSSRVILVHNIDALVREGGVELPWLMDLFQQFGPIRAVDPLPGSIGTSSSSAATATNPVVVGSSSTPTATMSVGAADGLLVSFYDLRHAQKAMQHLNGKQLVGTNLHNPTPAGNSNNAMSSPSVSPSPSSMSGSGGGNGPLSPVHHRNASAPTQHGYLDLQYYFLRDVSHLKDNYNQGTLVIFNLDPAVTNDELKDIFGIYGEVKEIRESPNKKHKFIEFFDVRCAERAMKALNKTDVKGRKIKIEPSRPGGSQNRLNASGGSSSGGGGGIAGTSAPASSTSPLLDRVQQHQHQHQHQPQHHSPQLSHVSQQQHHPHQLTGAAMVASDRFGTVLDSLRGPSSNSSFGSLSNGVSTSGGINISTSNNTSSSPSSFAPSLLHLPLPTQQQQHAAVVSSSPAPTQAPLPLSSPSSSSSSAASSPSPSPHQSPAPSPSPVHVSVPVLTHAAMHTHVDSVPIPTTMPAAVDVIPPMASDFELGVSASNGARRATAEQQQQYNWFGAAGQPTLVSPPSLAARSRTSSVTLLPASPSSSSADQASFSLLSDSSSSATAALNPSSASPFPAVVSVGVSTIAPPNAADIDASTGANNGSGTSGSSNNDNDSAADEVSAQQASGNTPSSASATPTALPVGMVNVGVGGRKPGRTNRSHSTPPAMAQRSPSSSTHPPSIVVQQQHQQPENEVGASTTTTPNSGANNANARRRKQSLGSGSGGGASGSGRRTSISSSGSGASSPTASLSPSNSLSNIGNASGTSMSIPISSRSRSRSASASASGAPGSTSSSPASSAAGSPTLDVTGPLSSPATTTVGKRRANTRAHRERTLSHGAAALVRSRDRSNSDSVLGESSRGSVSSSPSSPSSSGYSSAHPLQHHQQQQHSNPSLPNAGGTSIAGASSLQGATTSSSSSKSFELNLKRVSGGLDSRTTLMVKNIPNKYDQDMLLHAIDRNHTGTYDFFYLPIDFKNRCNVGYAFINFINPMSICAFYEEFNNKKWEKFNSEKVCKITYARIQGKHAMVEHFRNSSLMFEDPKCRPLLFHSDGPAMGKPEPFPVGQHVKPRGRRDSSGSHSPMMAPSPLTSPTMSPAPSPSPSPSPSFSSIEPSSS